MKTRRYLALPFLLSLATLSGCGEGNGPITLTFEKDTYEIASGEAVKVKENYAGITYEIKGGLRDGISLDQNTGVFTFTKDIPNYCQVMYVAKYKDVISAPTVVTLAWDIETPTITWLGDALSISDGGYIYAKTSNDLSIHYELTSSVKGVSIDYSSGRVSITSLAEEGAEFEVKASSYGAEIKKTFKVAKTNLAKSLTLSQCCEAAKPNSVTYQLDFSSVPSGYENDVLGLSLGSRLLPSSYFSYNPTSSMLTVKSSIFEALTIGNAPLSILTPRNTINVSLIKASKLIKNAEEIAAINNDSESLHGYYVLANDIDLTSYIETKEKANGWMPIGRYHDTTDGTALVDSFAGTFDGNGHVITNFRISRQDEYGFNGGFFGYVNNGATIKNLGIVMNQTTTSTVYSYSGGFVGVNNGTIENCWINYNLKMDNDANRVCGGFAGRNFNTIRDCYAYGKIADGTTVGAFLGENGAVGVSGLIENCYAAGGNAFAGGGDLGESAYYFQTQGELQNASFAGFSAQYWSHEAGKLPTLIPQIEYNFPYQIEITNTKTDYSHGDSFQLGVAISPEEFVPTYGNKIVYTSSDSATPVEPDGTVHITSSSAKEITFTATLPLEVGELTDTFTIATYPPLQSAAIVDDLPAKLEPGKKYRLNHTLTPSDAFDDAKWSLSPSSIPGVTLEGNILSITEDVKNYASSSFKVVLTVQGQKTEKVLELQKINYFANKVYVYSDSSDTEFSFTFPEGADLTDLQAFRYSKATSFRVEGQKVILPLSAISEIPNAEMVFTFKLKDGTIYRGYAMYVVKKTYDPADVPSDAIAIASVADFKKYFNVADYNPSRVASYYDKNFVLAADIDFEGETLFGIGTEANPFKGHIYGQGHTIANVRIGENEGYWSLSSDDRTNAYRSSKYVVGFFGTLNGTIQDVVFNNLNVQANNYVGTLAGIIGSNGVARNIEFVNSSVANGSGKNYSEGVFVTNLVAGKNNGIIDGVIYNGEYVTE